MKNWFDNIRIYHLLIDRFNGGWQVPPKSENGRLDRNNVFCGGNLQGVIEKLDYIKELGFTAIMLSPIFKSANYHGYHTLNFEEVDPHFGTWDDYQQLLDKAHEKGLKIICDFVPNHCWYEAPIFAESLLKNGGKHRDWFFYPEEGSDAFVSFLGFGDLPKFNLKNPEVVSMMIDKAEQLARRGVDAFRIDHALGQPHSFLKDLREKLQQTNSDIVVFGEVWAFGIGPQLASQLYFKTDARLQEFLAQDTKPLPSASAGCASAESEQAPFCSQLAQPFSQDNLQADYVDTLDGVLDFAYRDILLEELHAGRGIKGNETLRTKIEEHFAKYPKDFKLVLFLDNHDTDRFMFDCHDDVNLLQEAIELTTSLSRPFSFLYGTEQLMTNNPTIFNAEPYADLRVRNCMDWTVTPKVKLKN
jgi:glycosidase